MYRYGLVGNCQVSALISEKAGVDWLCMPRPDSPPVFGRLLDPDGGHFSVELVQTGEVQYSQRYIENTNVLVTEIQAESGEAIRVTDFCPRFEQYGRMYRPTSFFRSVEALSGTPIIKVSCKPVDGWSKNPVGSVLGNSHLRFDYQNETLRLLTNMPLTHLSQESAFVLSEKTYFALTWGSAIEDNLAEVFERFLGATLRYWQTWVKHCSIPSLYQKETIRSALTLKLHCFEDTGAILAALTTSLPEQPGHTRNWDYRYCWLRDAHFALTAFHNLGHFEEMEGFIKFLLGIAHQIDPAQGQLAPVYTLSQELPLPETEHPNWLGFQGGRPVRTFNQAAEHVQNDVYGEMILTLTPIYMDERFCQLRTPDLHALMAKLAHLCRRSISKPDAGLWEIRNGWQEHSFTNLMCWAGLERIARIQDKGFLVDLDFDPREARDKALSALRASAQEGTLRNGPLDETLDASLALLAVLGLVHDPLAMKTTEAIRASLVMGANSPDDAFFYRYIRKDDFGNPDSGFVICSFWVVQALARLGRTTEAQALLNGTLNAANGLGLFAEHYLPQAREQRGNFPQAYSHVGLINAAFAVSPSWNELL